VKVFDSCAVRDQEEIWQAANMINSYTHKKGFADADPKLSWFYEKSDISHETNGVWCNWKCQFKNS
jgi:hypothetical protein